MHEQQEIENEAQIDPIDLAGGSREVTPTSPKRRPEIHQRSVTAWNSG